jgi:hypothetical protein
MENAYISNNFNVSERKLCKRLILVHASIGASKYGVQCVYERKAEAVHVVSRETEGTGAIR